MNRARKFVAGRELVGEGTADTERAAGRHQVDGGRKLANFLGGHGALPPIHAAPSLSAAGLLNSARLYITHDDQRRSASLTVFMQHPDYRQAEPNDAYRARL